MGEVYLATLLCAYLVGGDAEVRHSFDNLNHVRNIRTDCETDRHTIEVGLDDRASSRDSVHQAVFASLASGKTPFVVLIDTDGVEGRYEQEMQAVTAHLGVAYATCDRAFILRWAATAPFRARLKRPEVIGTSKRLAFCNLDALASAGF